MGDVYRRWSWLGVLLATAACGAPEAIGNDAHPSTEQWQPAPPADGNLRIATFNIRNYPFLPQAPDAPASTPPLSYLLETDDEALLEVLGKLAFDVLAVQEIVDTERFGTLLGALGDRTGKKYESAFSTNAHSGNSQHVGIVIAADAARLLWTREHPEVDVRGTLRGGLSARIESKRDGGVDFGLMVLHLASGDSSKRALLRADQAIAAALIVASERAEIGDDDYLVMGDLNTARGAAELGALDAAFATDTALARQTLDRSCSAYWVKNSSSPLVRPSLLDHVYLSSLAERDPAVPVAAGAHCAVHRCEPYESRDAATGGSFWGVSDHCPVYFEIADLDDDAP